ncbi:MAG: hypothetical protein AAF125_28395, partial [Chloroflexota bacterium]
MRILYIDDDPSAIRMVGKLVGTAGHRLTGAGDVRQGIVTLPHGKDGQRHRKWLLFVVIELDWTPKVVMRCYRRRFGIECDYRQMRQMRVVSSSRNPAMKFFLLGLSFVLLNLWARLRWQRFQRVGRGPRTVMSGAFRLKRFIGMLRRAIEHIYGAVMS